MSELRIHAEDQPTLLAIFTDASDIRRELGDIGVNFERWQADQALSAEATQDEVIAAYRRDIERLIDRKSVV